MLILNFFTSILSFRGTFSIFFLFSFFFCFVLGFFGVFFLFCLLSQSCVASGLHRHRCLAKRDERAYVGVGAAGVPTDPVAAAH
jgi:hypothetical protein